MLKIDLLPRQFGIARTNRKLLALVVLVLIGALVVCFVVFAKIKADITNTQAELDRVKPIAEEVRQTRSETQSKESDLQPIQDKLQFIAQADRSGGVFWDRFHEINKYIWERAQVLDFSIIPPDSVQFSVTVHGTQEAGRFLINLLHCPALTGISISGVPAGKSVAGASGTTQAAFGGAPGMAGMPMAGMPGGGPSGMSPPMRGGPMPPTGGRAAGGSGEAGSPEEEIIVQVTASLTEPITIPQPPGAGLAAGAFGGMPGMEMPGMGMPDMAGPGRAPEDEDVDMDM